MWTLNGASGLEAYAATADGLGTVLYASGQNSTRDKPPVYVKYTVPLVDNGHVFVAGKGGIASYGLVNASAGTNTAANNTGATSTGNVGTGSVAATPPGPSGSIATDLPTFTWNNVTGAASYEIWLTDQTTNTHVTYANLTSTTWLPPRPLVLGDSYVWWVGAVEGNTLAWSEVPDIHDSPHGKRSEWRCGHQSADVRLEQRYRNGVL